MEVSREYVDFKERFLLEIEKFRSRGVVKKHSIMSTAFYQELLNAVIKAKSVIKKTRKQIRLLEKHDVVFEDDQEKLIFPTPENKSIIYYATINELFDYFYETHLMFEHCGISTILRYLSPKYKNVSRPAILAFLRLCKDCHDNRDNKCGTLGAQFRLNCHLNLELRSRGQVDIIDMQSHTDRGYKFIMIYQQVSTAFIILRPLKRQYAEDVAENLMDIFTLIGAPSILRSDIGQEFTYDIITNLNMLWPRLKIIVGNRLPNGFGQKTAKQDVKDMLKTWMHENDSTSWCDSLRFVQLIRNQTIISNINKTPYEMLFGRPIKIGLTTSKLAQQLLIDVDDENTLINVVNNVCQSLRGLIRPTIEDGEGIMDCNQQETLCGVCCQSSSGEYKCSQCHQFIHIQCGIKRRDSGSDDDTANEILVCAICYG